MLKTNQTKEKSWNSINDLLAERAKDYSDLIAIKDEYNNIELTYSQLWQNIRDFAAGLQYLGIKKGDHLSLFSENSSKWLIADQAILMLGAVNAVRGSQIQSAELLYILKHSDSCALVVENMALLKELSQIMGSYPLKFAVCLLDDVSDCKNDFSFPVYSFEEILAIGKDKPLEKAKIYKNDLATLVYSSGTTGEPKGIMLTHGNILSQIINVDSAIKAEKGKTALNILPIWHAYERTGEYYLLSKGNTMAYTNLRNFKIDVKKYKPNYLISVPRLWESLYEGIMIELKKQDQESQMIFNMFLSVSIAYKKSCRITNKTCVENIKPSSVTLFEETIKQAVLSPIHSLADKIIYSKIRNKLIAEDFNGISGGGALAKHLEDFFEALGFNIIVGYGLTETSPVLTCRSLECNRRYSAGRPLSGTEIMIIDPETQRPLKKGQKGLVLAKGPQVMNGYYKNEEATKAVLNSKGWLNTGDLGWMTDDNTVILTGRLKDTIVLSNGENVEPQGIEEVCLTSPYVKQIVLVGQDQSRLGALITPNVEAIELWAKKQKMDATKTDIKNHPEFQKFLHKELLSKVQNRPNFRSFERISCFKILDEEFSVQNGMMTQTAKIKKHEVLKRYDNAIEEMFQLK